MEDANESVCQSPRFDNEYRHYVVPPYDFTFVEKNNLHHSFVFSVIWWYNDVVKKSMREIINESI